MFRVDAQSASRAHSSSRGAAKWKLAALFACWASGAHAQQIVGAKIISHGIYEVGDASNPVTGASGSSFRALGQVRQVAETSAIPATLGVHFGFEFEIMGAPDDYLITYRQAVHYPPPGVKVAGEADPISVATADYVAELNRPTYVGYSITDPSELLPGKWVIQVWAGNKKVAEEEFDVVKKLSN